MSHDHHDPDRDLPDQFESRLAAALAGKYQILKKLGEGGMALVFLAQDVKHDRQVAVKVLRPELAASLGSERFLREIQVTAKLSHPHILPLYDSGAANGFLYYVMPYILGESLADLLKREPQQSVADAVRITREAAEALAVAHSYGLVHRDIKPANIMMSGGHAVVADFGISRAVSEAGGDRLTQTGMAIGTPAYMSPEQASGAVQLDGRADIYSLGCVLYEMLVGQVPFTGPNPVAIMARHTMDAVTPPSIMRPTISPDLEGIVFTALAKVPADRFRTATELAEALASVDTGVYPSMRNSAAMQQTEAMRHSAAMRYSAAMQQQSGAMRPSAATTMVSPGDEEATMLMPGRGPAPARKSRWKGILAGLAVVVALGGAAFVGMRLGGEPEAPPPPAGSVSGSLDLRNVAVLYFEDLSPTGELTYLADGLTEGLIHQLSQVPILNVITRNGVDQYRQSPLTRDSIARALDVGTLIDGTVEASGNRLQITTRLLDGESGAPIRRNSVLLPATDLLVVQDSVIQEVALTLREWLGDEVRVRASRSRTSNVAAWTLLQRAEKLRKDGERAVAADDFEGGLGIYRQADFLLSEAQAADGNWVEPVVLRGQIAYAIARLMGPAEAGPYIGQALGHAERALAIDAGYPPALELRGTTRYLSWLFGLAHDAEAEAELLSGATEDLEAAVRADRSLASAHNTLSHLYMNTGDKFSAVLEAQRAYEEDAYLSVANEVIWRLYEGHFDLEQLVQARDWCQEGYRRFPGDFRFVECQLWLMTTPAMPADVDRAWSLEAEFETLVAEPDREFYGHVGRMIVGGVIARAGLLDSARAVVEAARGTPSVDPELELTFFEAYVRTILGDEDDAIDLLKRYLTANPDQDHGIEEGGTIYWWWRPLRDNPRFSEISQSG